MNEPVIVVDLMDIIGTAVFVGILLIMGIAILIEWLIGRKKQ